MLSWSMVGSGALYDFRRGVEGARIDSNPRFDEGSSDRLSETESLQNIMNRLSLSTYEVTIRIQP